MARAKIDLPLAGAQPHGALTDARIRFDGDVIHVLAGSRIGVDLYRRLRRFRRPAAVPVLYHLDLRTTQRIDGAGLTLLYALRHGHWHHATNLVLRNLPSHLEGLERLLDDPALSRLFAPRNLLAARVP